MGASLVYLEEPNKEIEWETGEDDKVAFACGEMQGWRLNMVSVLHRIENAWPPKSRFTSATIMMNVACHMQAECPPE